MGAGRVGYLGTGGSLFGVYLMAVLLPIIAVEVVGFGLIGGIAAATRDSATGQPSTVGSLVSGLIGLVLAPAFIYIAIRGANALLGYYWANVSIEGKRCTYQGTPGALFGAVFVPLLLLYCTFGIYTPWFLCKMKNYVYSQVDVQGERLQYNGDGGSLLGVWLLGSILTGITCGIYFPWYHNNLLEYEWNNTAISGRPFRFQKDPGGFFGMWLLNMVLTMCTGGIYAPWAMSNTWDWEAKHVS